MLRATRTGLLSCPLSALCYQSVGTVPLETSTYIPYYLFSFASSIQTMRRSLTIGHRSCLALYALDVLRRNDREARVICSWSRRCCIGKQSQISWYHEIHPQMSAAIFCFSASCQSTRSASFCLLSFVKVNLIELAYQKCFLSVAHRANVCIPRRICGFEASQPARLIPPVVVPLQHTYRQQPVGAPIVSTSGP